MTAREMIQSYWLKVIGKRTHNQSEVLPITVHPKPIRGFTLIELMVVISIIAILATIGIVIYAAAQKNVRDGKRQADIQEIQKGLEQYYAINTSYPAALSSVTSYFQGGVVPTDPNGSSYTYHGCSTESPPKHYVVCATLENSKGNASAIPSDGCSGYTQSSGTTYYCASQLSN